jgi:hypothetical protein
MRDPDGWLIEVGLYTQLALDRFKKYCAELQFRYASGRFGSALRVASSCWPATKRG